MRRTVGLLALLTWLALPWLFWQSQRPVPRATVHRQVNGGILQIFSSDGRLFVCGDEEQVRVYDVMEGKQLAVWPRSMNDIHVFQCTTDGRALVVVQASEEVQVIDLITGKTVATFSPGPGTPRRVHLAPNGQIAATNHDDQILRIWDLGTGQQLAEFAQPNGGWVNFSPDSMRLAIIEPSGLVKVIDLSTREATAYPTSVSRRIGMTMFAPHGRLIGLGIMNSDEFGLWDLTNDRLIVRCRRASSGFLGDGAYWYVNHYPFFPLYSLAEQAGAGQHSGLFLDICPQRRIFETSTGRTVACVPQAISQILPDGKTLATFSAEEDCVQLWDLPPRTAVHPWVAWGVLGLATVLTGSWWHLRRKARAGSAS